MAILTTHAEIEELAGGRARQTIGLKPIAYRSNGNLTRILNRLGNTGDPNLPLGISELVNFRVRDKLSGNAPVVHFGKGQSHVRFTPLNTNNVQGQMVGENGYLYPNAWNNADLRLSIGGHILHKDIPLRTGHPGSFSFRLDAHQNFNVDTLSSAEFRVLDPVLLGPLGQSIPLTWAKSQQGGKTVLTVTLPAGDYAGWTLDPTLVLQPDETDGNDLRMQTNVPDTVQTGVLIIGEVNTDTVTCRSLIKFDLSSIPATATVSSATLSLYASTDNSSNARTFRMFRQLRAWVEAQATWNSYSTGNAWQTAGGFGALDCEQADIGSRDMTATETLNEFKAWSLTASKVQEWIAGTLTNNGLLAKADTELNDAYYFADSSDATAANRPKLTVAYRLPGGYVPILSRRRL